MFMFIYLLPYSAFAFGLAVAFARLSSPRLPCVVPRISLPRKYVCVWVCMYVCQIYRLCVHLFNVNKISTGNFIFIEKACCKNKLNILLRKVPFRFAFVSHICYSFPYWRFFVLFNVNICRFSLPCIIYICLVLGWVGELQETLVWVHNGHLRKNQSVRLLGCTNSHSTSSLLHISCVGNWGVGRF